MTKSFGPIDRRSFLSATLAGAAGLAAGASLLRADDEVPHAKYAFDPAEAKSWKTPPRPREILLHLRRRNPKSAEPVLSGQTLDPARVAIVVIDMWHYHWCKTCSQRVGAMVPRMNRALEGARRLGMQVIFAPTDCVPAYREWPQRRAVLNLPDLPPPVKSPGFEMTGCPVGGDPCGPGISCVLNYGENRMHPGLHIADEDLISDGPAELYKICRHRGLTHLIYAGIATNICVIGKPEALRTMVQYGLTCFLARDLTDAFGYPPQSAQDVSVAHIEKFACPSIDVIDTLREHGFWDDHWNVDPVAISPWGQKNRPCFFERSVQVLLESPRLKEVQIHYTLDGSAPAATSPVYEKPFALDQTATLRVMAFRNGQPVGLPSESYYVKLPPAPPLPSVRLFDLIPRQEDTGWGDNERRIPARMYNTLIRGKSFRKGLCVHAPSELVYAVKPEYDRFVAQAGVDDSALALNAGRFLGSFPSVTFQVHIDDKLVSESPVMRVSEGPWPFDVKIPKGAKSIKLVVTDAGDGSRLDIADWGNSGFVIPDYKGWEPSP